LNIEFTPVKDESIPFTIKLSEKSADSFEMTEYSGVLNGNKSVQVPLSVYTKTDITISPWGDITPDLLLQVIYTDQFGEKLIEGGRIGYWPDEDGY
jgi:hypothetical protein